MPARCTQRVSHCLLGRPFLLPSPRPEPPADEGAHGEKVGRGSPKQPPKAIAGCDVNEIGAGVLRAKRLRMCEDSNAAVGTRQHESVPEQGSGEIRSGTKRRGTTVMPTTALRGVNSYMRRNRTATPTCLCKRLWLRNHTTTILAPAVARRSACMSERTALTAKPRASCRAAGHARSKLPKFGHLRAKFGRNGADVGRIRASLGGMCANLGTRDAPN